MKTFTRLGLLAVGLALAACTGGCQSMTGQQAMTQAGQLFCGFQMSGGGQMVVALAQPAETAGLAALGVGAAAPVAILATNAAKAYVDTKCAQAATLQTGATSGVPVPPPVNPAVVPQVVVPK